MVKEKLFERKNEQKLSQIKSPKKKKSQICHETKEDEFENSPYKRSHEGFCTTPDEFAYFSINEMIALVFDRYTYYQVTR